MNVYIVMYTDPEGAEFLGAYSTPEKAMNRVRAEASRMRVGGEWSDTGVDDTYESIYVHKVIIDEDIRLG